MSGTLKLEIITPIEIAYSADVQMVTLPAVEGQIGIYPSHVALLTRMLPGEIFIRKDGRDEFLVVGEGLVEIIGDHVAVVTDKAIAVDKIDRSRGNEAGPQVEARLHDTMSDPEVATASTTLTGSFVHTHAETRRRES
jgi:F-type H+-transporting ATPase subunit epsilon